MKHEKIKTLILTLVIFSLSASAKFNFKPCTFITNSNQLIQILSIDDTDGVIAGMNYAPKATLKNKSSSDHTFIVIMKISDIYSCRRQITLSKNVGVTVMFDDVILAKGNYIFTATIYSQSDEFSIQSKLSIPVAIVSDSLTYK